MGLMAMAGVDENPRGVILVSSYPQRQGTPSEVLVRAELGGPSQSFGMAASTGNYGGGVPFPFGEAAACRVAVRSASHLVNRAMVQVMLDLLCDVPESAAAA